jgi:hypothetical protein
MKLPRCNLILLELGLRIEKCPHVADEGLGDLGRQLDGLTRHGLKIGGRWGNCESGRSKNQQRLRAGKSELYQRFLDMTKKVELDRLRYIQFAFVSIHVERPSPALLPPSGCRR